MSELNSWRDVYLGAILETDNLNMVSRIRAAQSAIDGQLKNGVEVGSVEHRELLDAQKAIQILIDERT